MGMGGSAATDFPARSNVTRNKARLGKIPQAGGSGPEPSKRGASGVSQILTQRDFPRNIAQAHAGYLFSPCLPRRLLLPLLPPREERAGERKAVSLEGVPAYQQWEAPLP